MVAWPRSISPAISGATAPLPSRSSRAGARAGTRAFIREIRLAARLDHPHILSVHDSGDAAGQIWFTMLYVEGELLRSRLAREPQLPLADALRITRAVVDALGSAQRQRIIHRDVKPENILLQGERCVLADFGVARAVDAAGEHCSSRRPTQRRGHRSSRWALSLLGSNQELSDPQ